MTTTPAAPAAEPEPAAYVIRKGGHYYRPNAQGYTSCLDQAGRFTLEEAVSYSHPNGPEGPRDGITYEEAPSSADQIAALDAAATPVRRVEELPMIAFADRRPVRDELDGEQTILIHNASATWDLMFFEAGEPFPDRWFGEHWIDISSMWPGVTAQVIEFHDTQADQLQALIEERDRLREENGLLRGSLKPFADTDLTQDQVGTDFAWDVLRARAALAGEKQ